jgi:hypothetical protein
MRLIYWVEPSKCTYAEILGRSNCPRQVEGWFLYQTAHRKLAIRSRAALRLVMGNLGTGPQDAAGKART